LGDYSLAVVMIDVKINGYDDGKSTGILRHFKI